MDVDWNGFGRRHEGDWAARRTQATRRGGMRPAGDRLGIPQNGRGDGRLSVVNRAPAFQFYPDDWLSSPKISTMTPAEEGAYIRLLAYTWNDPDCTIPNDDASLAILSRLGEGG
jgi:hypothetical protein